MSAPRRDRPFDLGQALRELAWPEAIVPPAARERLVAAAVGLPPIWECGVVESRLRPDAPVDLLAAVSDTVGRGVGDWPGAPPPELVDWASSPRMAEVPQVWLEWDDARTAAPPLFWWGVDPALYRWPRGEADPGWPAELGRRLGATPAVLPALERLGRALTPGGRARGIAHLAVRGGRPWRIFVERPKADLFGFFDAIGWPGDRALVADHWQAAIPPMEPGFLQLEFDAEGFTPYVAVEARETDATFSNRAPRTTWLRGLAARGLLPAGAVEALLAWPDHADTRWERRFHVKLVLAPEPPAAKVYLGFRPGPGWSPAPT